MKKINIAVDGYSSCGKSTLSKDIAKHLGYKYIDSGAMYRAVTYYGIRKNWIDDEHLDEKQLVENLENINIEFIFLPEEGKSITLLNNHNVEEKLRTPVISKWVPEVSKIRAIRKHLVNLQQRMGEEKGVIMDGRDIGTVVFPDAELKLFLTATPEIRAERRYKELRSKQIQTTLKEVFDSLEKRDYEDTHRAMDPLRQAADAIELNNSSVSIEQQFDIVMGHYNDALKANF